MATCYIYVSSWYGDSQPSKYIYVTYELEYLVVVYYKINYHKSEVYFIEWLK